MTQTEQRRAAKRFSQDWQGKGYEKGESQKFWLDLLCNVYGVQDFTNFVYFENQIKEQFTDAGNIHLKKELEVSKKAGDIIGEIYDAILKQYKDADNPSPATLKSLNMLCVRIVFCLYAEDAEIFGHKSMFGDYLKQQEAKNLRRALLDLFVVLDQKEDERDEYLEESLAAFPYVNGGLFTEEDKTIPQLTEEIKELLVLHASSEFDWSEISPPYSAQSLSPP